MGDWTTLAPDNETEWNGTSPGNSSGGGPGDHAMPNTMHEIWYITMPTVLILMCTVAVLINVRILVSTKWLRRPVSTTLFISLSLAVADTLTAGLLAIGLVINSLLPIGLGRQDLVGPCPLLAIEAVRLACILVTMIHLLAQACNHYLGILAPFKARQLTHNHVVSIVVAIWVIPIAFMFTYFSSQEGQGFQACDSTKTFEFLTKQRFRGLYSALIFIPLIIMFFIYCHISVIVRRHQMGRQRYTRQSRHGRDQDQRSAQQQFDRNLKAIWTTLLILSSYMICLMPVVMSFALVCEDCYIENDQVDFVTLFIMGTTCNSLLVIKPLLNPLIYASRMQEIRAATRRMNDSCRRTFYPFMSGSEHEAFGSDVPRRCSVGSRTSTRRHHYSLTSTQTVNGFSTRSLKRRTEDLTTDL